MSLTDQQLIRAFCDQNDTAAFGELVSRHQDRLINSLTRMLGSYEEACDVGQEAFLQAFRKLHSFRRESQFYTWLFRIARVKIHLNHGVAKMNVPDARIVDSHC